MNTSVNSILRVASFAASVLPLSACAGLVGLGTAGQVLEEGTEKPIPNAIVVVRWAGSLPAFTEARAVCVHVETTTTDQEGRYRTPAWHAPSTVGPAPIVQTHVGPSAYAYKPGYEYVDTRGETVYLKPFAGTREARLRYLSRAAISRNYKGDIDMAFLPLYKALYAEARKLAVTKDDRLKALYRLRDVERLELGADKAWENFRQREKELR